VRVVGRYWGFLSVSVEGAVWEFGVLLVGRGVGCLEA